MLTLKFKCVLLGLLLSTATAFSHPVIFKGGIVGETEQTPIMQNLGLSYTFHPQTALAFDYLKFNELKTEFYFAKINYRLFRQNSDDSQGNIYLSAGTGQRREDNELTPSHFAGIHADWEDRDYYISGFQKYVSQNKASSGNTDPLWMSRARIGFSPFRADYNDINVWFMAQFDKMNGRSWETTPLMRTYFKNVLWELGASLNGNYQINLMFHL